MTWKATAHVGVYWEGYDIELCAGPRWLVHLRALWHIWRHPYRVIRIQRIEVEKQP